MKSMLVLSALVAYCSFIPDNCVTAALSVPVTGEVAQSGAVAQLVKYKQMVNRPFAPSEKTTS